MHAARFTLDLIFGAITVKLDVHTAPILSYDLQPSLSPSPHPSPLSSLPRFATGCTFPIPIQPSRRTDFRPSTSYRPLHILASPWKPTPVHFLDLAEFLDSDSKSLLQKKKKNIYQRRRKKKMVLRYLNPPPFIDRFMNQNIKVLTFLPLHFLKIIWEKSLDWKIKRNLHISQSFYSSLHIFASLYLVSTSIQANSRLIFLDHDI